MSGKEGIVNVEVEGQMGAEGMGIGPSWGIGTLGWGTGTVMVGTMRLEMVTGSELRVGSELRPSLQKICEWRNKNLLYGKSHARKQKG